MKKTVSLVLALVMILSVLCIAPITANAETKNLTFGKTYTGTLKSTLFSTAADEYTFTMTDSQNVQVEVGSDNKQTWRISGSTYSEYYSSETAPSKMVYYLKKGVTYTLRISGSGTYSAKVTKAAPDKLILKSTSGKIKNSDSKLVRFSFTGPSDYALANLSIKSSNEKVATASYTVTAGNTGTITITPKFIGTAKITLKMAGSNSVKYTVYVTNGFWFVAKGSKAKAPKPKGVKNPKWSSSKKKVVTINKKTGKIKAKKSGRTTLTAKKGKIKYKITTVVTDYVKLGKKTYREIKDVVNNPEKLKIYNVYKGYSKMISGDQKIPVVVVDYGSTNSYGAMVRNKVCAYYDEVLEIHYKYGWDVNNIIGKKRMKVSKIK